MNTESIIKLIKETNGRFFSVSYKKKDGSIQQYTARMGVKKYLKGGVSYKPDNSITVYSVSHNNPGYKTLLIQGIQEIKSSNISIKLWIIHTKT